MKPRFVLCFLAVFFCCLLSEVKAQTYFEQNVTLNVMAANIPEMGIDYSCGVNLDDVFFVGVGIGVGGWLDLKDEYYGDFVCPVFGQVRTTFLKQCDVRPYISLSAGVDCMSAEIVGNSNLGISFWATNSAKLYLGVGYSICPIEYDWVEYTMKGTISAHLGISF